MDVTTVRSELQITSAVLSDNAVLHAIEKFDDADDDNLIYAEVLRMVLRKHQGIVERRIGKYSEVISPKEIRRQINNYMHRAASTALDDGFEHPDSFFDRKDSAL